MWYFCNIESYTLEYISLCGSLDQSGTIFEEFFTDFVFIDLNGENCRLIDTKDNKAT